MGNGLVGLGLVEIACMRMLIATVEATYKAAFDGDGLNVAVSGAASLAIIIIGASAVLLPGFWLGVYVWIVGHAFGGLRS